jgi:cell division septation protein DedD
MTEETRDTAEITLGTGKLLGIFFGLAVICAVFFTLGYMLGRGSSAGARTEIVTSLPNGNSSAIKPSAANNKGSDAVAQTCVAGSANCPPAVANQDSASSNPAANKTPDAQLPSANSQSPASTGANNSTSQPGSTPAGATAPEMKNVPSGSYIVQVAAVSKQEDAEILVAALRKKQYPVFLSSGGGDSYFRVQVGPFTDVKEAETMRARLAGEGYNPIVKK